MFYGSHSTSETIQSICQVSTQNAYYDPSENIRRKVYVEIKSGECNQRRKKNRQCAPLAIPKPDCHCRRKTRRCMPRRERVIAQSLHEKFDLRNIIGSSSCDEWFEHQIREQEREQKCQKYHQAHISLSFWLWFSVVMRRSLEL